jgi:hypothetical protein
MSQPDELPPLVRMLQMITGHWISQTVGALARLAIPDAVAAVLASYLPARRAIAETPDRWTLLAVPGRLARLGVDPWKDYWGSAQVVPAASFAAVRRISTK